MLQDTLLPFQNNGHQVARVTNSEILQTVNLLPVVDSTKQQKNEMLGTCNKK